MAFSEYNLDTPVPSLGALRAKKTGYRNAVIDTLHELHNEPLVLLSDYGVAGQSYYSRPNAIFESAVEGVSSEIRVRRSIAETLQFINHNLAAKAVSNFFDAEVELYVEEGVRTYEMQEVLYETHIPRMIKRLNPELTTQQINTRRDNVIARPAFNSEAPSPHATGGAVDVVLRYKQNEPGYVDGSLLPFGHADGDMSEVINPDYFEDRVGLTAEQLIFRRNRRALYNAMSGRAFQLSTGVTVNPTEYWHWDRGNHLWAVSSGEQPYYGLPK